MVSTDLYLKKMLNEFMEFVKDLRWCKTWHWKSLNRYVPVLTETFLLQGQQDLNEMKNNWMQVSHLMKYFKDTHNPKSNDFMSKFFDGHGP